MTLPANRDESRDRRDRRAKRKRSTLMARAPEAMVWRVLESLEPRLLLSGTPPIVDAGEDRTVIAQVPLQLAGSFSDPDPGDTHTIAWDFGDGSDAVTDTLSPTHVFAAPGNYSVRLTVMDSGGESSFDELMVTVDPRLDLSPTVLISGPSHTPDGSPTLHIEVTDGAAINPDLQVAIDVDLNNDGDFDEPGERGYQSVPLSSLPATTPVEWASKVLPSDPPGQESGAITFFGATIAVDGDYAVVGAPESKNPTSSMGAAYVLKFESGQWRNVAKLIGSDTDIGDLFGASVAIDGDTIAIGASNAGVGNVSGQGAVYFFTRMGETWTQTQVIHDTTGGKFGIAIALEGDTLVVGRPENVNVSGYAGVDNRVVIYQRASGEWALQDSLVSSATASARRQFGTIVAIDAGRVMAREVFLVNGVTQVLVHTIEQVVGEWMITDSFTAPPGINPVTFAESMSLDGDRLMVSAAATESGQPAVAAIIYARQGGTWELDATLLSLRDSDQVTRQVALENNRAVVSSSKLGATDSRPFVVEAFEKVAGRWVSAGREAAPYASPSRPDFISALALEGGQILTGYSGSDEFGQNTNDGAVYTFSFSEGGDARGYTGEVTLDPALAEGTYAIRGRVTDGSGQSGYGPAITMVIDATAPMLVTASPADNDTINNWTTTLRLTFDEVVIDVDATDLLLTGPAAITAVVTDVASEQGGKVWVFTIDGLSDGSLSVTFAPDAGDVTDLAGNVLLPVMLSFDVLDDAPPTVVSVSPPGRSLVSESVDLIITFSEPVLGLTASDLLVEGLGAGAAMVGEPVQQSDTTWLIPVSGLMPGLVKLTLAAGVGDVTDRAGNALTTVTWELGVPGTGVELFAGETQLDPDPLAPIHITTDSTPALAVVVNKPGATFNEGEPVSLDIDRNGDGDFDDAGETAAATSSLQRLAQAVHQQTLLEQGQGTISGNNPHVIIRGDLAVVTVRDFDTDNTNTLGYLYQRNGGVWTLVSALEFPTGGNQLHNRSAAIGNGTVVIGSPNENGNQGLLFVFDEVGGIWSSAGTISKPVAGTLFGQSVSISGDLMAVGMPSAQVNNFSGAVFLYQRVAGAWNPIGQVVSPDGQSNDFFGSSVTLQGDRLVVGAEGDDDQGNESGSVYVFDFNGSSYNFTQKLLPSNPASSARFGADVALDGDTIVVGSLNGTQTAVFQLQGLTWLQTATLADTRSSGSLRHVAVQDGLIVVSNVESHIYQNFAGAWRLTETLTVVPPQESVYFSGHASIDGDTLMLGARLRLVNTSLGAGALFYALDLGSIGAASFDVSALDDGLYRLRGRLQDADGNRVETLPVSLIVEAAPLTVTELTPGDAAVIDVSAIDVDVTFSSNVTGVDTTDLVLSGSATNGAVIRSATKLADDRWRFHIIGLRDGELTLTLAPDAGDIRNLGGADLVTTVWNYTIAGAAPPQVILAPFEDGTVRRKDQVFEVVFSETVKSVDVSDLVISGAAAAFASVQSVSGLGPFIGGGFTRWEFFVTNLRSGDLQFSLAPDAGDIVNLSGTAVVPIEWDATVDLSPRLDGVGLAPVLPEVIGSTLNVTFSFTAPVFNLDPTDVLLTGSAAVNAVVGAITPNISTANGYKFTITGLNDGDLIVTLAPEAGDIVNEFGDDMNPYIRKFRVIAPPESAASIAGGTVINQSQITLDITLSEAVDVIDASDLALFGTAATHAAVAAPTHLGGNVWRFVISGLSDGFLAAVFAPHAGRPIDVTGNGAMVTTFHYLVDAPQDVISPVITGVTLGSSAWSAAFNNHPQTTQRGFGQGYLLPAGAGQSAPLTWSELDLIRIEFNENVDVQADDLILVGVNVNDYAALLSGGSFSYDAVNFVATWQLAAPLQSDKLRIVLDDRVTDTAGNALDGEWTDGFSSQSGDGLAGGDFAYRFNVLPGDSDGDGAVTGADVTLVRAKQFKFAGNAGYDPKLDIDGSAAILATDVIQTRNRIGQSLPEGEPSLVGGQGLSLGETPPSSAPLLIQSVGESPSILEQMPPIIVLKSAPPAVAFKSHAKQPDALAFDPRLLIAWDRSAAKDHLRQERSPHVPDRVVTGDANRAREDVRYRWRRANWKLPWENEVNGDEPRVDPA
ncbi:MAG: PKD domain-containing protein [Phycisphaeraceae bacterium]